MPTIRFRFTTGVVSATQLFVGRGRPKFFSLLVAQVAEAVKSVGVDFGELYKDKTFRKSIQQAFEEFKRWFFEEVVPRNCIQKGDLFLIALDAEVDTDANTIRFYYDRAEVAVWRRVASPCGEAGECEKKLRECESRFAECQKKIESLRSLLS